MWKQPTFALAAIGTLALGIGVNTAVFSVVNAIVLRPLPVRGGDRLVVIASHRTSSRTLRGVSFPDLQDYRAASADAFEDIAGYSAGFLGLAPVGGRPERVLVTWVTGNYFQLLDLRPSAGRLIQTNEGLPDRTDPIVVLGYGTWQRRFAADPSVVGRIAMVNGTPCTIVGVAPAGFQGTFAFSEAELFLPLNWRGGAGLADRDARGLHAIARLRPGVSIERARAVLSVTAERLARRYPHTNANVAITVVPEHLARPEEDQYRTNSLGAAIMLAMVILVLVIAAVNVTSLLLARTAERYGEMAIRAALGAGRARLFRQMVTESLLLTGIGAAAGVLAGVWTAYALSAVRLPGDLPVRFDFGFDGRVLAYTVVVTVLTGLLVGLLSAARVSGADLECVLRGSRGGVASPGRRAHGILVVAQIGCCFVLLSFAASFVRSLFEAERADLGFQPESVLNMHMDLGQLGYTEARGRAFFAEVERRIRSIPGVQHVSFAFTIPMGYIRLSTAVEGDERAMDAGDRVSAGMNIVGADYFETMGIPIVRGRGFSDADNERSRRVAVVNQRLADVLWPRQDPVGRRFKSGGQWVEIVGVARTGRYHFLFEDPQPYVYLPIAQAYSGLRVLHVRASTPLETLTPALERTIHALEPHLPLYDVQSMTQALGSGLGFFPVRVAAFAVSACGLLAFLLAIVGLYGVTAYVTSQRTHDIGVRMAIGATAHHILRLVMRDGWRLVSAGVALGLLVTLACSRVVGSFLFGISANDAITLTIVTAVLSAAAFIACAVPAWRAAHMDPTAALRSE